MNRLMPPYYLLLKIVTIKQEVSPPRKRLLVDFLQFPKEIRLILENVYEEAIF